MTKNVRGRGASLWPPFPLSKKICVNLSATACACLAACLLTFLTARRPACQQGPDMLRRLAIGTRLASRVPIQIDTNHDSGGALGGIWGSSWPLEAGSLVLGAFIYQHKPDPEGQRRPITTERFWE